jgi:hypothetical protein
VLLLKDLVRISKSGKDISAKTVEGHILSAKSTHFQARRTMRKPGQPYDQFDEVPNQYDMPGKY